MFRSTRRVRSAKHGLSVPITRDWKTRPVIKCGNGKQKRRSTKDGKPFQIDGPLAFAFQSRIEDPLPILTVKGDIDRQSIDCPYNPTLPEGILPSGQSFKIRIGVNEKGEQTGITFPPNVHWSVFQAAHISLQSCKFKPYIVHGQPTYYGIEYTYTAP